jgi:hypothetical protein
MWKKIKIGENNHIGGKKKKDFQSFKNWTYVLHDENNFVKYLMKALLNWYWIKSHLWILLDSYIGKWLDCRFLDLFITHYFKLFI